MVDLLSNLIIEDILTVTRMFSDTGAYAKRENREVWAMIIKYEGETVYKNANKIIVSNINNIVILPRGCSYEWKCTKKGHYACLEFQSSAEYSEILSFPIQNGDELLKIFTQLEYKNLQKKKMYRIECIRDVYNITLKLAQTLEYEYIPSDKSRRLSNALDYILTHYTENITNDYLASLCGISTVYFRKLFKAIYGKSPIDYAKSLKIKKACEMLGGDFGSISDISVSLGYPNIYDFSRDFKKHIGVSPSKYIKGAFCR